MDIFYLDFAKASDKVPKKRLIAKLKAKGLDQEVVKWNEEWLTDRTQRIVINGSSSSVTSVDSGVPQGSILGPFLFMIFHGRLGSGGRNHRPWELPEYNEVFV